MVERNDSPEHHHPRRTEPAVSRRGFLKGIGGTSALAVAAGAGLGASRLDAEPLLEGVLDDFAEDAGKAVVRPNPHVREATRMRAGAARAYLADLPNLPLQRTNGDEELYADYRGSFFKCLPQNEYGEVDPGAFEALKQAMRSGRPEDCEAVPLDAASTRKLANPQAAFAFDMTGLDSHGTRIGPPPAFASAAQASEMLEVYWQALTRDVPFADYLFDRDVAAAVDELSAVSAVPGSTQDGRVTPRTLFRGETLGDLVGPYVSQFLWQPIPYGPARIDQRYGVSPAGVDYMTDHTTWLDVQRGAVPVAGSPLGEPRYIYNSRSLGDYVHADVTFQAFFNAALILGGYGGAATMPFNPYRDSLNQGAFATFGLPDAIHHVTQAAVVALKGAWFQKWLVHRKLRPEVMAGRVHFEVTGQRAYGVHSDLLGSQAVARLLSANGTAFLPLAYAEGSPTHPSYPAGHAAISGACATILKAFFHEDFVIPNPVVASRDGSELEDYRGADLTIGGEVNKLAANIAIGRDAAGVHYRADGIDGLLCGEQQAIGMLRDCTRTYNEAFDGFVLTTFGGDRIRIAGGEVELF